MTAGARITVGLPSFSADARPSWEHVLDAAAAADDAGIDRVVVSDHVVLGEDLEAYGNPETGGVRGGRQPTGPDGHWLEPLTVLTAVAARTTNVRLGTYILLAALRRPVTLAKQLATLDVLSHGRVDLGVGVGWQREEYEAAGLDFAGRGRLLEHSLEVCQTLWTETRADYASSELRFDGIHQMPKPIQPGGVPIWVSGRCGPRVAGRIARFGGRWIPWGDDADDPASSIPRMRASVDEAGGDGAALSVLAPLAVIRRPDKSLDAAASGERLDALAAAGVTDVLVYLRTPESRAGAFDAYSELVAALRSG